MPCMLGLTEASLHGPLRLHQLIRLGSPDSPSSCWNQTACEEVLSAVVSREAPETTSSVNRAKADDPP